MYIQAFFITYAVTSLFMESAIYIHPFSIHAFSCIYFLKYNIHNHTNNVINKRKIKEVNRICLEKKI